MRKGFLALMLGVVACFQAGDALGAYYYMSTTGGRIWTTDPVTNLNADLTGIAAFPGPYPDFVAAGSWEVAGWWEFDVTYSTGADWNPIMIGGQVSDFHIVWDGTVQPDIGGPAVAMPTAEFNIYDELFTNIYGVWYENNPDVWTYFTLYVDPTSGDASTPGAVSPVGVFAFVAKTGANYDLGSLLDATVLVGGRGMLTDVPEPTSLALLGMGMVAMVGYGRRRFRRRVSL